MGWESLATLTSSPTQRSHLNWRLIIWLQGCKDNAKTSQRIWSGTGLTPTQNYCKILLFLYSCHICGSQTSHPFQLWKHLLRSDSVARRRFGNDLPSNLSRAWNMLIHFYQYNKAKTGKKESVRQAQQNISSHSHCIGLKRELTFSRTCFGRFCVIWWLIWRGSSPVCPLKSTNTYNRTNTLQTTHSSEASSNCSFSQASHPAKVKAVTTRWAVRLLALWVTVGRGRLQSQLASPSTIKTGRACCTGEKLSWLNVPDEEFFQYDNLEWLVVEWKQKGRKRFKHKTKANPPSPKIFALLRIATVIWCLFESNFGDTLFWGDCGELWHRHIICLTGKLSCEV